MSKFDDFFFLSRPKTNTNNFFLKKKVRNKNKRLFFNRKKKNHISCNKFKKKISFFFEYIPKKDKKPRNRFLFLFFLKT